mmetsp:Transcript_23885/g.55026  ORF Transcript_23885/g.55026 Transcript_23885/m.55026 type:complete len:270 (-) Transcript_23885:526-1335(-)
MCSSDALRALRSFLTSTSSFDALLAASLSSLRCSSSLSARAEHPSARTVSARSCDSALSARFLAASDSAAEACALPSISSSCDRTVLSTWSLLMTASSAILRASIVCASSFLYLPASPSFWNRAPSASRSLFERAPHSSRIRRAMSSRACCSLRMLSRSIALSSCRSFTLPSSKSLMYEPPAAVMSCGKSGTALPPGGGTRRCPAASKDPWMEGALLCMVLPASIEERREREPEGCMLPPGGYCMGAEPDMGGGAERRRSSYSACRGSS